MVIVLCIIEMLREVIKMIKIRLTYADDEEKEKINHIEMDNIGISQIAQFKNYYFDSQFWLNLDDVNELIQDTYVELYKTIKNKKNIIVEDHLSYICGISLALLNIRQIIFI